LDRDLRLDDVVAQRIAGDVAFVPQHVEDGELELRGRRHDGLVACHLRITDAGQQVCDWIGHAHGDSLFLPPYQLALVRPGMSPRIAASRILLRASLNFLYTPLGRPVTWQRLRMRVGLASRGIFCSWICASHFSSSLAVGLLITALRRARFSAKRAAVRMRFCSFMI